MSNERVLIVDDEQAIRRFLRVTLASQAYTVIEASSGQEALSGAATQKPDIVILDLGLPDVDGVEVTRLLRQWTQIPIIILSVRGSERDKIAALDAGQMTI
jgi:two-component system KDP operon response regulator KdpE